MKKLVIAFGLISFAFTNAQAQTKSNCVCRPKHTTAHHYKATRGNESYDQNFKVCKGNYGYRICGQRRTYLNSTQPGAFAVNDDQPQTGIANRNYNRGYNDYNNYADTYTHVPTNMVAPQSQSYPVETTPFFLSNGQSFEGYYPQSHIIVGGDNATAPYDGLPSPQYDGPAKNKQRNLKVNSPEQNSTDPSFQLPPSNGSGK